MRVVSRFQMISISPILRDCFIIVVTAIYREEVTNLMKKYLKVRCIKDGKKTYVNPSKEKSFSSPSIHRG